jgi:nicotinamidase-related amidase
MVDPKLPIQNTSGGRSFLDPADSIVLLLDHQEGLLQTVKDNGVAELRANISAVAKLTTLMNLPVITTALEPNGPSGPLIPEIHRFAPHAVFVPRDGEINPWNNSLFLDTVRQTGRRTLFIAGVWTSVCVMFAALDARAAGFEVYAVIDASGDPSEVTSRSTIARFVQAGIVPISTAALVGGFQQTWKRSNADEFKQLHALFAPSYREVQENFRENQATLSFELRRGIRERSAFARK